VKRTRVAVTIGLMVAMLATACSHTAPAPAQPASAPPRTTTTSQAGTTLGNASVRHFGAHVLTADFTAALAVVGDKVVGYVCDCRTADAWFSGQVVKEGLTELKSTRSTVSGTIAVTLDAKQAVGTVTWRGKTVKVSLPVLSGQFGLYRAKQGQVSGGWIRLPSSEAPASTCGLVTANNKVTASSPFTGTGTVDVAGYGKLTPQLVDQI
jgi:hypothetical protein